MKKIFLYVLLALSMFGAACAFAACGNDKNDKGKVEGSLHRHVLARIEEKEPTCYYKGSKEHWACISCDKLFADEAATEETSEEELAIECLPHVEIIDGEREPTCTRDGRTRGAHCYVCHAVLIKSERIPAAHRHIVTDAGVEATCLKEGLTEGKHCFVCKTVLIAQEVIPIAAHKEVIDKAVEPTCTKEGLTEGKHCSVCNKVFIKQEIIPATGRHNWNEENACASCGLIWNYTEGLEYQLNEDRESYCVAGIGTASGDIVIPYFYGGKPVTAIKGDAFHGCDALTGCVMPDSITTMGLSAFHACGNLTSVTISNCLTKIANGVFFGCTSLESVVIPDSVKTIGRDAFYLCRLKRVTFGNGVEFIGVMAFFRCAELSEIVIPKSVVTMEEAVFEYCEQLTEVTILGGITVIAESMFEDCRQLTSVSIPKSVVVIESGAFSWCQRLNTIRYEGTMEEWNAIEKGTSSGYGLDGVSIVCSDGKLDKEGNEIESNN